MTYRLLYFFIRWKDWDLAEHFWMRQQEVLNSGFGVRQLQSLVKNRNMRPALSCTIQRHFHSSSFFLFFFRLKFVSVFTLTCNAAPRTEIKWGLRFRLIQAILNIHPIVAKQFSAALFNYAAEQRQWMLKHLERTGIIFVSGSPEVQGH